MRERLSVNVSTLLAPTLQNPLMLIPAVKLAGCDLALDSAFEGPAPVFGDLPLQELDLERCPHVTDSVVSALGALYPGLRHLTLAVCAAVTDASLLALAGSCRQLETLSLRRCWRVSETGLEALARLGSLRALCLANVPAAGPALLRTLAAYCGSQLERLDVSWCRALPDHALGQLVDSCPRLTRLDLWGCTQVTPRFLEGHGKLDLSVHGAPRSLVQAA